MVLNKLNELKNRANCAIMCAMADAQTVQQPAKQQSKTAVRAKKIVSVAVICAVAASLCAVTAFAAGEEAKFFEDTLGVLTTVLVLIGAGLGIWGIINLLEGYGNDNPGAKSQGMKQLMAGAGIAIVGIVGVPALSKLFTGSFNSSTGG